MTEEPVQCHPAQACELGKRGFGRNIHPDIHTGRMRGTRHFARDIHADIEEADYQESVQELRSRRARTPIPPSPSFTPAKVFCIDGIIPRYGSPKGPLQASSLLRIRQLITWYEFDWCGTECNGGRALSSAHGYKTDRVYRRPLDRLAKGSFDLKD